MKRFKTKQEFTGMPADWGILMNYLFGLPFNGRVGSRNSLYPHLADGPYEWHVRQNHLTTAPHPYGGKEFAVECENTDQVKKARKKMIALGFEDDKKWNDHGEKNPSCLFLIKHDHGSFDILSRNGKLLTLTFQEFWEGYWPEIKKGREDAYVESGSKDCSRILLVTPRQKCAIGPHQLHNFNILSQEEFEAKHPPKLMFKEWEVTSGEYIEFGCPGHTPELILGKGQLREFMTIMGYIHRYKQNADDVYGWLKEHKKELGL